MIGGQSELTDLAVDEYANFAEGAVAVRDAVWQVPDILVRGIEVLSDDLISIPSDTALQYIVT